MTPEKAKEMNEEKSLENGNKPFYPLDTGYSYYKGLTKREFIATNLLNGYLSSGNDIDIAVELSIKATDKLLIELGKSK